MNTYIRDYEAPDINTNIAHDINSCKQLLNKNISNSINCFHTNIRSLSANFDEACLLVSSLNVTFDFIVFTETFHITDPTLFSITGYNLIYNEGKINKNDGVVVYIKENLEYTCSVVSVGPVRAISINALIKDRKCHVLALYRNPNPCTSQNIEDFNVGLENFLKNHDANSDINIFIGDININLLSNDQIVAEYTNILNTAGYLSTINTATRTQGNSSTCLDHLFVKTALPLENLLPIVLNTKITDHYPILLQMQGITETKKQTLKYCKQKTYINYNSLKQSLNDELWTSVYTGENINESTDNFIAIVKKHIQKSSTTIKINKEDIKRHPWITKSLIKQLSEKEKLYKLTKSFPDNIKIQYDYRQLNNMLKKQIKMAKREYFQSQINKNKNNTTGLWQCVKNFQNSPAQKAKINCIELENGRKIENKKDICNAFNSYFSEIGQRIVDKISQLNCDLPEKRLPNSIVLLPTDRHEVKKTILSLKNGKSPGIDEIRAETLKIIANQITEPLTYLINTSFTEGSFPDTLKKALVKPLFKNGDKLQMSNYRPISILSNISKIFEKIIKVRLGPFFEKYKLISENQYGFREARSTQDALAALLSRVYRALDQSERSLCVFVDLTKAFDTVSHERLICTLENNGIRDKGLELMRSYLTNRDQFVSVDNYKSEPRKLNCGVPQGTVLGPLLFNLYVNNLFNLPLRGEIVSFADDTAVFYRDSSWANLKRNVETDFSAVLHFFQSKLLTINIKKTFFIPFTCYAPNLPNFNKLEIPYQNNIVEINSTSQLKYLGVMIDNHLRWNVHIEYLVKKMRGLLSKFKLLKQFCSIDQLKTIYYALIQSQISYGILVWGGLADTYLSKLVIVQKWLIKIIYNRNLTYPTEQLYRESELFDPIQLYVLSLVVYQFSLKRSGQQTDFHHEYETRQKHNLLLPSVSKTKVKKSFLFQCLKTYNALPLVLKDILSLKLYKAKVKVWILDTPREILHRLVN